MIAMRCDKAAFVNRRDRTSTCVACHRPVGGMSNRDQLVIRRTVAFASPACNDRSLSHPPLGCNGANAAAAVDIVQNVGAIRC